MNQEDVKILEHVWVEEWRAIERSTVDRTVGRCSRAPRSRDVRRLTRLVNQMFVNPGPDESEVSIDGVITGYYQRSKNRFVVAVQERHLVGIVEVKSQVTCEGNNGVEAALGNSLGAHVARQKTGHSGSCQFRERHASYSAPK